MCTKIGVPADDDASTVVSLSGEILSPKYEPEIIAPAIQPSENPSALPIPKNAIPIVATVVHELPVSSDTIAHIMQQSGRKKSGFTTFSP